MTDPIDKRRRRFEQIDSLTPDMRELVNDEGWTIVDNFMRCGVRKPNQIRHLINLVRDGTAAYGNGHVDPSNAFVNVNGKRVIREP